MSNAKFAQRKSAAVGIERQMIFAERMIANDDVDARAALEHTLFSHTLDNDEDVHNMFARWQTHVPAHPLDDAAMVAKESTVNGSGDVEPPSSQGLGDRNRLTIDSIIQKSLWLAGARETAGQSSLSPGRDMMAISMMVSTAESLPQVGLDDVLPAKSSARQPAVVTLQNRRRKNNSSGRVAFGTTQKTHTVSNRSAREVVQQDLPSLQRMLVTEEKLRKNGAKEKFRHGGGWPVQHRHYNFDNDDVSPGRGHSPLCREYSVERVEYFEGEGRNGSPLLDLSRLLRRRGGSPLLDPEPSARAHELTAAGGSPKASVAESPPWMKVFESSDAVPAEGPLERNTTRRDAPPGMPAPGSRAAATRAMLVSPAPLRAAGRVGDGPSTLTPRQVRKEGKTYDSPSLSPAFRLQAPSRAAVPSGGRDGWS